MRSSEAQAQAHQIAALRRDVERLQIVEERPHGGTAPSSSADTAGKVGEIRWDASYLYIKTASGWRRATLNSW